MKRFLLLTTFAVLLALAPAASARVVELGSKNGPATASCPTTPCAVLARVTGYPGHAGTVKNPYYIRRDGYLVAFTVPLGTPTQDQIDYFTDDPAPAPQFGEPEVQLSVLRKGDKRKTRLNHRLLSQSPGFEVGHYFGSSPTFVLTDPLRVRKGNIVALTTSTWAPAFANTLSRSNWWRASRPKDSCDAPESFAQFSMTTLKDVSVLGCTYHGTLPLYTVTYIPDNRATDEKKKN
jgi:hypothetical protein